MIKETSKTLKKIWTIKVNTPIGWGSCYSDYCNLFLQFATQGRKLHSHETSNYHDMLRYG